MMMKGVSLVAIAALLVGQTGPLVGQTAQEPAKVVNIPAGTKVPLTLVSAIKTRSTKVGDTVRAVVAFPVTTGDTLAIPAGSFMEGTVTKLVLKTRRTSKQDVEIHFTRLLFANGYTVTLDANNEQAKADTSAPVSPADAASGVTAAAANSLKSLGSFALFGQTQPTLPPLPQVGPSPGVIVGATLGGAAALLLAGILFGRHRANQDAVLLDAGWQFQAVTTGALVLDGDKVRAAAALGN
jgi:type IV secretion system protein VirB10